MHFAYGRNCAPEDLSHIGAEMVLIDKGDAIDQFAELVTDGLRKGDVLTLQNKNVIPKRTQNKIEKRLGVEVRVQEKEGNE